MIVAYFFGPPCIFVQCKGVDALIYMKDGLCVHDVATSACLLKGGPKKWRFFCIPLLHTPELHQILTDLFHCLNQENICNNTLTRDPTTPQVCSYTTLWNVSVFKATTENKTTSVTTHFKSASSSSKATRWTFDLKTAGCDSYFR